MKVVILVDGEEVAQGSSDVPDWAVNRVIGAIMAQIEEPDLEQEEGS